MLGREPAFLIDGVVFLDGGACAECGFVFFPFQVAGCERCGAHGASLTGVSLAASGTVISSARVHIAPAAIGVPVPFDVAEIALADGPIIRGILTGSKPARAGSEVKGTLLPEEDIAFARRVRFAVVAEVHT